MKKKQQEIKKGEIIIFKSKNGPKLDVRLEKETVWLSLNQIAGLFDTDKSGISRHIGSVYQSGELKRNSTVAEIATVQIEGNRSIKRSIEYYSLDVILSVGYRVNSKRATQFRIWATKTLKQHLVKGYTINEKRLLQARSQFDELQEAVAFLQEKGKHELLIGQEHMIKRIKNIFCSKHEEKKDFSSFFTSASEEEKRKLMEDVARKANEDQRGLMERYERTNHKAA